MTPVIYTFLGILQNLSNNHTRAQLFLDNYTIPLGDCLCLYNNQLMPLR